MAWPNNINHVDCIGFPKTFLPAIRKAIENDMVKWGRVSMFAESAAGDFEWVGCRWILYEQSETVYCIRLDYGSVTAEDLTAAMIKGKIES